MGDYRPKVEQRIVAELGRALGLLLIALFQVALAPSLWYFQIDWVLVVIVSWTLLRGFAAGLHSSIYGGLALDLLSPLPIGTHLLALLVAVTAIAVLTDPLPRDNRLVPITSVLLASVLYTTCVGLIMSTSGRPVAWGYYPFTIVLPSALANGVAALPTYFLLDRLQRRDRPAVPIHL
jgi:rod shape-determining protein MreD